MEIENSKSSYPFVVSIRNYKHGPLHWRANPAKRGQSFDFPWTSSAFGQILVSLTDLILNLTNVDELCTSYTFGDILFNPTQAG